MHLVLTAVLLGTGVVAQSGPSPQRGVQNRSVPSWVKAGPMIGHVGPHAAHLWVMLEDGTKLGVRGTCNGKPVEPAFIRKLGRKIRLIGFTDLPADAPMIVQLHEGEDSTRGVGITLRTAPLPSKTGRVRIAFGSCVNDIQFPNVKVYAAAARARPDVFLFVGDNTYYVREYRASTDGSAKDGKKESKSNQDGGLRIDTSTGDGDWVNVERMFDRQMKTRQNKWLQPLIRTIPCYAVWDDHDYGPNNADRMFPNRKQALEVFTQMWANPSYGIPGTKGCFSSFRRGPVEVFLMDDRYHKYVATKVHPKVSGNEATIWGETQFRWLCDGLRKSTAPVKLIANGTQFLHQGKTGEGHFQEARKEYERLLDYLHEHRIGGVVFLTGDRHSSEMMALRRKGRPLILDFTSSPIAWNQKIGPLKRAKQATTVWQLRGDSYGLVTVDIQGRGKGTITCEVLDENNKVPVVDSIVCKSTWQLSELHY